MKVKARHKLIPALVMMLVAAVTLSSASYAWFTMNKTVTATDFSVTATAPANLEISLDGNTYANTVSLEVADLKKIMPASSNDGKAFFAVDSVDAEGKPATGATIDDVTAKKVTTTANGYYYTVDLYVKQSGGADVNVSAAGTLGGAFATAARYALLNVADGTTAGTALTDAIFNDDGTNDFFTGHNPISATGDAITGTTGTVYTLSDGADIFVLGDAQVQHMTLVIWIEGQDDDCLLATGGANMDLTLDLTFTADEA